MPWAGERGPAKPWLSALLPQELYASYNDVSDLSPLCLLEQLEVLDLEANSVDDREQLRYLQLCPRLATLTLEGNPVCLRPGPGASSKVRAVRPRAAHPRGGETLCGPPMAPGASLPPERGSRPAWAAGPSPGNTPPAPCDLFTRSSFSCIAGDLLGQHQTPQGHMHTCHTPQPTHVPLRCPCTHPVGPHVSSTACT